MCCGGGHMQKYNNVYVCVVVHLFWTPVYYIEYTLRCGRIGRGHTDRIFFYRLPSFCGALPLSWTRARERGCSHPFPSSTLESNFVSCCTREIIAFHWCRCLSEKTKIQVRRVPPPIFDLTSYWCQNRSKLANKPQGRLVIHIDIICHCCNSLLAS